jgi:Domain of unknown function (DUF1906)
MVVKAATAGLLCFDVDQQLTDLEALEFVKAGYEACGRYIPRTPALIYGNLSSAEISTLLAAGLGIFVAQHCPEPGWSPSATLGQKYGSYAAQYAAEIGLPKGMHLWLDLETPAETATAQNCIDYENAWSTAVKAAGYLPGVYVGYGLPLSPTQLFKDFIAAAYWSAYNYTDGVATRGVQITQHTAEILNGISFDPNMISADLKGNLPMLLYNS